MPVFEETSRASRELRNLPTIAPALPRLTPRPPPLSTSSSELERYEVVVIGAGPAGLFLTLNLSRLGLRNPSSLICFDAKSAALKAGQADGLQARTLEVLRSLSIHSEILEEGCHMREVAFWNPTQEEGKTGIERTTFVPDIAVRARYAHEVTIHQGRIERIMEENLALYKPEGVVRNATFSNYEWDEEGDAEFPIIVTVEQRSDQGDDVKIRKVRAKYLVGADGAHSKVRKAMGLRLEGESQDHVWGVCDFIADTDFPDIRKRCAIHSDAGSLMIIPREEISGTGEYLTRLYVQAKEEVPPEEATEDQQNDIGEESKKQQSQQRRQRVTQDYIFEQANRVFAPYSIKVKEGTEVDWYAAYQIGQRMTPEFSAKDKSGVERVFIVGDACHTHSPKAGQGMNVSMMDSYNLSWKLVHTLHGLSPVTPTSDPVLSTFAVERSRVAKQLIEFDTKFSSMFSGAIGGAAGAEKDEAVSALTHDEFLKVFRDGNGFTSGCGIEYPESLLTKTSGSAGQESLINSTGDHLDGHLRVGTRLVDTIVRRYADANPRHLQDDFPSTGRYRILVFTSTDILKNPQGGRSAKALSYIDDSILPLFPRGVVQLTVVHPFKKHDFEWSGVPPQIRKYAEMRFYGVGIGLDDAHKDRSDEPRGEDVYGIYGVDPEVGAAVLLRPDGYIGVISRLEETNMLGEYLRGVLKVVA